MGAVILFWYVLLTVVISKISYVYGYDKGWHKGHEDTKKATFDVLGNDKGR